MSPQIATTQPVTRHYVQESDSSEVGTPNTTSRNLQSGAAKARKRGHDTDSSDPGTPIQASRNQPVEAVKTRPVVVKQTPSVQPPKPRPRSHPRTTHDGPIRQRQRHVEAEESEGLETGDSCDESGESARDMYRDSILALRSRPAALHQVISSHDNIYVFVQNVTIVQRRIETTPCATCALFARFMKRFE